MTKLARYVQVLEKIVDIYNVVRAHRWRNYGHLVDASFVSNNWGIP